MLAVLEIVFPIYALIGAGFVTTRLGVFSESDIRALGHFILALALPALIFTTVAARPLSETVQLPYVTLYGLGTLTLIAGLYAAYRAVGGCDHATATLATMGSTCPNSGFVGYPILLLAMPEIAGQTLAQNVLVELILLIPVLLVMLELGGNDGKSRWHTARRIAAKIFASPLVLAILAGIAVSAAGIDLPPALDRPLEMLAAASGAASLIVIGGTLARLKPAGVRALAGYIVAGKLLLHPLMLLACVALANATGPLDISDSMRKALILTGAVPTMGIFPVLAQAHGREGFASAALFGGTVASLFTLSALLLVLF